MARQATHAERICAVFAREAQAVGQPLVHRILRGWPDEVARDACQTHDPTVLDQGLLDGEAPAGTVVGKQMPFEFVVHSAAGLDHALVLLPITVAQWLRKHLGGGFADQLCGPHQTQAREQCAIAMGVPTLGVLAEEHHVGQLVEQGETGGLQMHGAIVPKSA